MLPSSNFGQKKKKTSLTNKITVRSLKISSPALDIHPFRPKLILMMSTFQVCGRNYVETIQMKPFFVLSLWSHGETNQMKTSEQYFSAVLFV